MAINPKFFGGLDAFARRTEEMIAKLHSAPIMEGVKQICYPGEPEFLSEARALKEGIELPGSAMEALARGAVAVGIKTDMIAQIRHRYFWQSCQNAERPGNLRFFVPARLKMTEKCVILCAGAQRVQKSGSRTGVAAHRRVPVDNRDGIGGIRCV